MGAKHVCFCCRKAVNVSYGATGPVRCTDCGAELVVLPHRFRPPKKREAAKWAARISSRKVSGTNISTRPIFRTGPPGALETTCASRKMRVAKAFVEAYHARKSRN
jgi:hypothetical protein